MRVDNFIIDPQKRVHLQWWAEYFKISAQALLTLIAAVGVRALDVQCYLDGQVARKSPSSSIGPKSARLKCQEFTTESLVR
jgi:uncharacterized protein DUF3606